MDPDRRRRPGGERSAALTLRGCGGMGRVRVPKRKARAEEQAATPRVREPLDAQTRWLRLLLGVAVIFAIGSGVYYFTFEPWTSPDPVISVRARHILVKTRTEADKIKAELLEAGGSFDQLAAKHSTDKSNKDQGGDLGWFTRGNMLPAFEEAAFGAELGKIVGPVETSFGFHVIKVEEKSSKDKTLPPPPSTPPGQ